MKLCDNCGAELPDPPPSQVDSRLGLWAWNTLHSKDQQRTELFFCNTDCCYRSGVKLGEALKRRIRKVRARFEKKGRVSE